MKLSRPLLSLVLWQCNVLCAGSSASQLLSPGLSAWPACLSICDRRKQEEEANAVEKKGHMGDFYRNLLRRWGLGWQLWLAYGRVTAGLATTCGHVQATCGGRIPARRA